MALAALLQADPRAIKVAAQIRAQQRVVAPRGIVIPDEYIDEVAQAFVRVFQVGSALDIDALPGIIERQYGEGEFVQVPALVFQRKSDGLELDRIAVDPNSTQAVDLFEITSDRRYDIGFIWSTTLGVPVFCVSPHRESSLWGDFFAGLGPFVAVVAALTGLPPIIGEAVLGAETAAAYPVVADAVGKAAIQLVLTGGDIEKSLTGAVASVGGAEVGSFVGSAVDSTAIGQVTRAATTAAIQGRNAGKAATRAALFAAAGGSMGDFELVEVTLEDLGIDPAYLANLDIDALNELQAYGFTGSELFASAGGDLITTRGLYAQPSQTTYAAGYHADAQGNILDLSNNYVFPADQAANMTEEQIADELYNHYISNQGQVVDTKPGDAARPDSLPQTSEKAKVPTITDQAKVTEQLFKTAANIRQSVDVIRTGKSLPYQTNPYGLTRPQVPGVTITRPDGSTVVNNGNGTQTVRYPDGRVVTQSTAYTGGYAGGSLLPGVSNQTLLIGGAILVGALLLARRK